MQWHRLLGAVCRHSTGAYFCIDPRIRINAEHETRSNARGLTGGSLSPTTSFALAAGNTNPQGIADPPVGSARPTEEPPVAAPAEAEAPAGSGPSVPRWSPAGPTLPFCSAAVDGLRPLARQPDRRHGRDGANRSLPHRGGRTGASRPSSGATRGSPIARSRPSFPVRSGRAPRQSTEREPASAHRSSTPPSDRRTDERLPDGQSAVGLPSAPSRGHSASPLNVSAGEDRCYFLRCYRNPTTSTSQFPALMSRIRLCHSGVSVRHATDGGDHPDHGIRE